MRYTVAEKREDGLSVFPSNRDPEVLNNIRRECPDRASVILAVGIYRGLQIAANYAEKHAPDIEKKVKIALQNYINSIKGRGYGKDIRFLIPHEGASAKINKGGSQMHIPDWPERERAYEAEREQRRKAESKFDDDRYIDERREAKEWEKTKSTQ